MLRIATKLAVLIVSLAIILTAQADDFGTALSQAALERTKADVTYDGRYIAIDYPNGDVPANIGVCTDVVIRS